MLDCLHNCQQLCLQCLYRRTGADYPRKEQSMANSTQHGNYQGMTRRSFIAAGSAASISVVLPRPLWAQETTIVSTVFGGFFEAAYRKHVVAPFEKSNNVKVILKYGTSGEWVTNSLINRAQP